jgi:hypothetical protein
VGPIPKNLSVSFPFILPIANFTRMNYKTYRGEIELNSRAAAREYNDSPPFTSLSRMAILFCFDCAAASI